MCLLAYILMKKNIFPIDFGVKHKHPINNEDTSQ